MIASKVMQNIPEIIGGFTAFVVAIGGLIKAFKSGVAKPNPIKETLERHDVENQLIRQTMEQLIKDNEHDKEFRESSAVRLAVFEEKIKTLEEKTASSLGNDREQYERLNNLESRVSRLES